MPSEIYISSSWKNRELVRELAIAIRELGYRVYDFTDPSCRKTVEMPPEKTLVTFDPEVHAYGDFLKNLEWFAAVEDNRAHIDECAAIVLVLPCGIDATADWAYGFGRGKPSIILGHPPKGEQSPCHLWADAFAEDQSGVLGWLLKNIPKE